MKQGKAAKTSNTQVDYSRWVLLGISASLVTGHALGQSVSPPPKPGLLANTMTAAPLTPGEKLDLRLFRGVMLRGTIGSAFAAGISQATNTPGEWGRGIGGYGQRYASGLGMGLARQATSFTAEVITHQDPRYFPTTQRGLKPRLKNVLLQTFLAKNDRGETGFAYSKIIGALAAGQLANVWMPASNDDVGQGFQRSGLIIVGDAGVNLLSEFFPFLRSKAFRNRP